MKLNGPPTFPVNPLLWISKVTVSADKRHRQAAFQPKHCQSVLNIMPLAPKTAPSGRLLNKTAPFGPATDFTNRLFPLIRFCSTNWAETKQTGSMGKQENEVKQSSVWTLDFATDPNIYIDNERLKTGVRFVAILFEDAITIAKKYDYMLPTISNQRYNTNLKILADICGITKPLHTHIGRHTAACYLLNKGLSLEIGARIMGHSSTKITRHYAKLLDKTVFEAVQLIEGRSWLWHFMPPIYGIKCLHNKNIIYKDRTFWIVLSLYLTTSTMGLSKVIYCFSFSTDPTPRCHESMFQLRILPYFIWQR